MKHFLLNRTESNRQGGGRPQDEGSSCTFRLNADQNATGHCAAQVLGFTDIIMQLKCQWRWLSARRGMPLCLPQKQWWAARLCAELEHSGGVSSLWYLVWWLGSTSAESKLAFNYMKLSNICRELGNGSARYLWVPAILSPLPTLTHTIRTDDLWWNLLNRKNKA